MKMRTSVSKRACSSERGTMEEGKWGRTRRRKREEEKRSKMIHYMIKRLRNISRELWKNGSHPGLNRGPLT